MAFGASSVVIEELTGKRRRLELVGAGLPFQGASWGSRLVMTTSWNPGNGDDATQHVLSASELPGAWNGEWNTTRLVSSPAKFRDGVGASEQKVARASSLREIFESIQKGGQRLRVTWAQGTSLADRRITREGLCEEVRWVITRADDIAWEMSWAWAGHGSRKQRATSLRNDKLAASFKEANAMLTDFQSELTGIALISEVANQIGSGDLPLTLADLETIANTPQEFMRQLSQTATLVTSRFEAVASLVKTIATAPTTVLSQAIGIAENATTSFAQIVDDMGQVMPDAYSEVEGDAAALATAASFFAVGQDGAERVLGTMAKIKLDLRERQSALDPSSRVVDQAGPGGILDVYLSRQGDTFASVSLTFYATPDYAHVIASSNGFDDHEIAPPPGSTLIIPNLTPIRLVSAMV